MPKKSTKEEFVLKSDKLHHYRYDYDDVVYINNSTPVWINCHIHGKFIQIPNNHLSGSICPKCAEISRRSYFRNNTNNFIKSAINIHGNKFDYSNTVYGKNNVDVVSIICKKHGMFLQTPNDHLDGCGCPNCGKEKSIILRTKTTRIFINESEKIWGDLYNYSKSNYIGCENKVIIICKKHGEFLQTPNNHVNCRQGCPKCKFSKGELKILMFLNKYKIDYICQHWFSDCRSGIGKKQVLKFDFYIPSKNLLIEYNGKQHYKSNSIMNGQYITTNKDLKNIQDRDKIKYDYAQQHNIKLFLIKYTQFNNIENILKANLTI